MPEQVTSKTLVQKIRERHGTGQRCDSFDINCTTCVTNALLDALAHEPPAALSECPYCKRPADGNGGIYHVAGCAALEDVRVPRLQYDALVSRAPSPPRVLLADEMIAWQCGCGWINLDRESPFCAGCDTRRPSPTKSEPVSDTDVMRELDGICTRLTTETDADACMAKVREHFEDICPTTGHPHRMPKGQVCLYCHIGNLAPETCDCSYYCDRESKGIDPQLCKALRAATETSVGCRHCGSKPLATENGRCEECGKYQSVNGTFEDL